MTRIALSMPAGRHTRKANHQVATKRISTLSSNLVTVAQKGSIITFVVPVAKSMSARVSSTNDITFSDSAMLKLKKL